MGLSSKTQTIANQPPMTSSITCSVSYISIISGVWAAKLSHSVWYFHPVSNIWVNESSGAIIPICMEKMHEKATCLKHFETTSNGTSIAMFSMFSCHVRWWVPYLNTPPTHSPVRDPRWSSFCWWSAHLVTRNLRGFRVKSTLVKPPTNAITNFFRL